MRKILPVLFCLLTHLSYTQDEAYYASMTNGADLFHISLNGDSSSIRQAYAFEDSIKTLKVRNYNYLPLNFTVLSDMYMKEKPVSFIQGPFSSYSRDSIEVSGKWHIIECTFSDDGFIGGRPNQVEKQITVSDLGLIYSFANFLNAHTIFMLCHNDPSKQNVLNAVYKFLEGKNDWLPWKKIYALTVSYTFENCQQELLARWLKMRNHLKLVSITSENKNGEVHYSATIKNTSDIAYALPEYYSIAPSRALIKFNNNGKQESWNLLESHYGPHFKRMNKEVFLSPGEEFTFSHVFRSEYSYGDFTITYEGFQVYSYETFFSWVLSDHVIHNGKTFIRYASREIKN
jgi:hypothetical protein